MREAVLDFSFYIQHFLQAAGVSLLVGMGLFVFGAWLHRMGVFAVSRRLLWSIRGAFLALALVGLIVWAGTKPNLGLVPLLQLGDGETNEVEHVITPSQVDAGFALARTGTNETHDFSMPAGASEHAPWRLRGANRDRFALASHTNAPWAFMLGTNVFDGFSVSSSGALVPKFAGERFVPRARLAATSASLPTGTTGVSPVGDGTTGTTGILPVDTNLFLFSPFFTNLGAVPMVNWAVAGVESGFWWTRTPSNSLVVTWHDFLYNRDPSSPVSFQAEFLWNGDFVYRYDLSRAGAAVSAALAGAFNGGYGEYAEPSTNLTSAILPLIPGATIVVSPRKPKFLRLSI